MFEIIKEVFSIKGKFQSEIEENLLAFSDEDKNPIIARFFLLNVICTYGMGWLMLGLGIVANIIVLPVIVIFLFEKIIIIPIKNTREKIRELKKIRDRLKRVKGVINKHEEFVLEGNSDRFFFLADHSGTPIINDYMSHNLEKFIQYFISSYNYNWYTVDSITLKPVCNTNKRRSLGDIFLTCRCYFPSCTMEQVLIILIDLLEKKKIGGGSYCNTIYKYVFHNQSKIYNRYDPVEYSKDINFEDLIEVYKKK